MERRTKIICTLGPSSAEAGVLERMIECGMDVARINFSHGSHKEHFTLLNTVRRAAASAGKPVAVLGDLQGPKIRVGKIGGDGKLELKEGDPLTISPSIELGAAGSVGTSYESLSSDLSPGDTVLLDDGLMSLTVEKIEAPAVHCRVRVGGMLSSHKGLNLPGVKVNLPALTPKDEADLDFMIENEFEYAGLSFVQSAGDIRRMRDYIGGRGSGIRIVAKIEKPAALDDLEGILAETDGVMVARGDLGVELSVECVPSAQKKILRSAAEANVLSITATQMLESMTRNPVPTRAEAGDVANAVFDGTDALMLSGETAVGKYPVETVAMAASIATEAEKSTEAWSAEHLRNHKAGADFADSICHAAAVTAEDLGASAIVVGTQTGETALLMSKFRPSVRVVGISADEKNVRRMAAMYGVYPMHMPRMDNLEESVSLAAEHLVSSGVAAEGDIIVLTFGAPLQGRGMTNMLRLARIGDRYGVDE